LFDAAKVHGLEGILAKDRNGKYLVGKPSNRWLKIKERQTAECFV
jgi:bifunctional non-homologous end joining protein LigD